MRADLLSLFRRVGLFLSYVCMFMPLPTHKELDLIHYRYFTEDLKAFMASYLTCIYNKLWDANILVRSYHMF